MKVLSPASSMPMQCSKPRQRRGRWVRTLLQSSSSDPPQHQTLPVAQPPNVRNFRTTPPAVDQNPTGSLKADARPDSKGLPTATDAELARKEEVLWQLKKRRPHLHGPISAPITGSRGRHDDIHK